MKKKEFFLSPTEDLQNKYIQNQVKIITSLISDI